MSFTFRWEGKKSRKLLSFKKVPCQKQSRRNKTFSYVDIICEKIIAPRSMTMTPFLQLFRLPPKTVSSMFLIFHLCPSFFISLTSHMASFERTSAIIDTRFESLWQASRCWCRWMNSTEKRFSSNFPTQKKLSEKEGKKREEKEILFETAVNNFMPQNAYKAQTFLLRWIYALLASYHSFPKEIGILSQLANKQTTPTLFFVVFED